MKKLRDGITPPILRSSNLRSRRFRLLLCVLVLVNGARRTFSAKVGARGGGREEGKKETLAGRPRDPEERPLDIFTVELIQSVTACQ